MCACERERARENKKEVLQFTKTSTRRELIIFFISEDTDTFLGYTYITHIILVRSSTPMKLSAVTGVRSTVLVNNNT